MLLQVLGIKMLFLAGKAENIFDRVDYNRKHNKRDRAGRSWSDNEDKQLDNEYNSIKYSQDSFPYPWSNPLQIETTWIYRVKTTNNNQLTPYFIG